METSKTTGYEEQHFSVWVDWDARIVSFQKVDGFDELTFRSNEEKLSFVVKRDRMDTGFSNSLADES